MAQHDPQNFSDTRQAIPQRNSKGHFAKGNTIAMGASGNPDPDNQFQPGNQAARKHGMFANLFTEASQEMFEWAKIATLNDELNLCRVMLQMNLELIRQLEEDIRLVEEPELKHRMQDGLYKMEVNTVMWISRIESMTKTISKVRLEAAQREKERQEALSQMGESEETENR